MAVTRRQFVMTSAAGFVGAVLPGVARSAPAVVRSDKLRPAIAQGVASGDVTANSAILWSRTDRPAEMLVEWSTTESFKTRHRVRGPAALRDSDFTAKLDLTGLPAGERIFYRVRFRDLSSPKVSSAPLTGSFRTASRSRDDLFFAWSGDTAGQGFGINPDFGGMKIYESIRRLAPQFFIHSGDAIYADGPIPASIKLDDGTLWKNVTTEATSKVAETLAEFRGNYLYNLLDDNVRRFNAEVPMLVQWDDHETTNNWYPGEMLDGDGRYTVKSASLLAARGKRAFLEYMPIRTSLRGPERIYRRFHCGPPLDVFLIDMRSFRGANSPNRQPKRGPKTAILGGGQLRWLKRQLLSSRATWKVIASDMPIGLIVRDGKNFEAVANGNGPALGRELEIAELLRFIKANRIRNVVWLTADVHYAAAHYYDPGKAKFTQFSPFWEFVAGPMNAGTFGPNELDDTFGPQVRFQSIPQTLKPARPPSEGLQFFGTVKIDGKDETLTVQLHNLTGKRLYSVELPPAR